MKRPEKPGLEEIAWNYGEGVLGLIYEHNLYARAFSDFLHEPDHISIAAPGTKRFFDFLLEHVESDCREASSIQLGQSFIVNAAMRHAVDVHTVGDVNWFRFRQASGKKPNVDYMAFLVDDVEVVKAVFGRKRSLVTRAYLNSNPPHVNVVEAGEAGVDDGIRLKFVAKSLAEVTRSQVSSGQAEPVDWEEIRLSRSKGQTMATKRRTGKSRRQ